jgi:hypothetical protein
LIYRFSTKIHHTTTTGTGSNDNDNNNNSNNNNEPNDQNEKDDFTIINDWDDVGQSQQWVNTNTNTDNYNNQRTLLGGPSLFSPPSPSTSTSSSSSTTSRSSNNNYNNDNGFVVNEREVQLVSLFERTLPIQIITLLAIISFTIYIGLSGGITDGSDRYTYSDMENDMDTAATTTTTTTTILLEPEISKPLLNDASEMGPSVFL